MGIWDFLYHAGNKAKENAPDITPVANYCRESYKASVSAANNVCKAVAGEETRDKLKDYLPGFQSKQIMKQIGSDVVLPELLRYTGLPGLVQTYRIIYGEANTLHGSKNYEQQLMEHKEILEKMEEIGEDVKRLRYENKILADEVKSLRSNSKASSGLAEKLEPDSAVYDNQKAERVLIEFMTNGVKGRDLLGNLFVNQRKP